MVVDPAVAKVIEAQTLQEDKNDSLENTPKIKNNSAISMEQFKKKLNHYEQGVKARENPFLDKNKPLEPIVND